MATSRRARPLHSHKPVNISDIRQSGDAEFLAFAAGESALYFTAHGTQTAAGHGALAYRLYRYLPDYVDGKPVLPLPSQEEPPATYVRPLSDTPFPDRPTMLAVLPPSAAAAEAVFVVTGGATPQVWRQVGEARTEVGRGEGVGTLQRVFGMFANAAGVFLLAEEPGRISVLAVDLPRGAEPGLVRVGLGLTQTDDAALVQAADGAPLVAAVAGDQGYLLWNRWSRGIATCQVSGLQPRTVFADAQHAFFVATDDFGEARLHSWDGENAPAALPIEGPGPMLAHGTRLFVDAAAKAGRIVLCLNAGSLQTLPYDRPVTACHGLAYHDGTLWAVATAGGKLQLFRAGSDTLTAQSTVTGSNPRRLFSMRHGLNLLTDDHTCWNLATKLDYQAKPLNGGGTVDRCLPFAEHAVLVAEHDQYGRELFRWWSEPPHASSSRGDRTQDRRRAAAQPPRATPTRSRERKSSRGKGKRNRH